MKKLIVFVFVMMMAMSSLVFAKDRLLIKVEVTDIDSPFERTREFDTSGKVPSKATYRISEIEWSQPEASKYEVTVTIIPNVGYIFSGDANNIIATINGKEATSQEIIEEDEFKMSYIFTEKAQNTIGNDTLRHRIIVYFDSSMGMVDPNGSRVLDGDNETFHFIPYDGYKVKEVIVDGLSLGEVEEYDFRRVKKSHEIRVFFEKADGTTSKEDEEVATPVETKANKPIFQFLLDLIQLFKL